jgi:hypothetical protein
VGRWRVPERHSGKYGQEMSCLEDCVRESITIGSFVHSIRVEQDAVQCMELAFEMLLKKKQLSMHNI